MCVLVLAFPPSLIHYVFIKICVLLNIISLMPKLLLGLVLLLFVLCFSVYTTFASLSLRKMTLFDFILKNPKENRIQLKLIKGLYNFNFV